MLQVKLEPDVVGGLFDCKASSGQVAQCSKLDSGDDDRLQAAIIACFELRGKAAEHDGTSCSCLLCEQTSGVFGEKHLDFEGMVKERHSGVHAGLPGP